VPQFIVQTRDGSQLRVDAVPGRSVMEAIKEQGIEELLAICGGCCSCATCHVHVDAACAAQFPPMGDEEALLLDASGARTPLSRLSCQLPVLAGLEGARFTIAPAD
jgi:2Fe-2S ferredoxin